MIPFPYPPGANDATRLRITQVYRELCEIMVRNERQNERINQIRESINIEQEKLDQDMQLKKELEKEFKSLLKVDEKPKSNSRLRLWFWIAMTAVIVWNLYNVLK